MSNNRQRMTWAALSHEAAAAPALPGYGVEDQDHPAHTQGDPEANDYQTGDTSSFAEDVHPGPYTDSGPPALPGYGVEDKDHPAHKGQVGRQGNLMEIVRRKSAKALVLAQATLGKKAAWNVIEDQAFDYMKAMDESSLNASLERLGGDFLGMEDEFMGMDMDDDMGMDDMGDEFMGMDMDDDMGMDDMGMDDMGMDMGMDDMGMDDMGMDMMASQNDPDGETLGTKGKGEKEEKKEEGAVSAKAARLAPVLAMFDAYDGDSDGFVVAEDWGGPRAMFAALDTDNDGIIARTDLIASDDDDKDDKGDDDGGDEIAAAKKKASKKSDDDGDDDDGVDEDADVGDEIAAAKKKAYGHLGDFDEDELEMLSAMDFDMDEDPMDEGMGMMAAKKGEEDDIELDDEPAGKEASEASFFAMGHDPMGLADGTMLTAEDEAAFDTAFGRNASDDEDEDKDKGTDKEATLASLLAPQPRTASTGVRSVGAGQTRTASSGKGSEIDELSNLWASKPDVSGSFG